LIQIPLFLLNVAFNDNKHLTSGRVNIPTEQIVTVGRKFPICFTYPECIITYDCKAAVQRVADAAARQPESTTTYVLLHVLRV